MTGPAADIKRSLVFATGALDPLVPLAREAQAANFHRVWTTEYLHRDAVARALAIALGTETINVGTGIAYAFARVPLQMAALAADVQRLADGRFGLGISTGTRGVRRWYGADFEPPAPRIAEYVQTLRETWRKNPDLAAPPPIYAAALNPIMTKTVARDCDGALLHALSLSRVHLRERVLPALEAGRAARTLSSPLEVAAWCIASIDADEELARERARRQLAFYLVTPSYRTVAAGTPWAGAVARVQEAFNDAGRAPEVGALRRADSRRDRRRAFDQRHAGECRGSARRSGGRTARPRGDRNRLSDRRRRPHRLRGGRQLPTDRVRAAAESASIRIEPVGESMGTTVLLSDDQEEIRRVSRSFLEARFPSTRVRELMRSQAGFERSDWREIADLGWPGIAIPEDRGGAGYGTVELCILLEEMGRVLLGDPFLGSAVLAANAIAIAGTGPSADALVTAIAEGATRGGARGSAAICTPVPRSMGPSKLSRPATDTPCPATAGRRSGRPPRMSWSWPRGSATDRPACSPSIPRRAACAAASTGRSTRPASRHASSSRMHPRPASTTDATWPGRLTGRSRSPPSAWPPR